MLPAKMADRIMLPDKLTEMENSIGYHTSINQSEESISIRCIIIYVIMRYDNKRLSHGWQCDMIFINEWWCDITNERGTSE